MTTKPVYSTWAILQRVLRQIRSHWPGLIFLLALGALKAPVALLMPLPLKIVLDNVLGSHPLPLFLEPLVPSWIAASPSVTLWFAVALVVMIALLGLMLSLGTWVLQEYLGEKITLEFRSNLFEHVTNLSLVLQEFLLDAKVEWTQRQQSFISNAAEV